MSWPMQQLNEVADFRLGKMLDEKKNRGDLMPYLANVNVRWGEFDFRELREMRFEDHELDTFGLRHGDIVMCEGGEPGRCAIWKEQRPGMMIQKAIHRIRPHACLNHEFLYYTFLNLGMTGRFSPLFTGATIKHLPREKIALLEVPVPPLPEQIRIASVLSAYDDLIENNRRRMALLEESARLLYQEWFVRLRFPGHEHVRIVDGVPEGWERRTLKDFCPDLRNAAQPGDLEPGTPYIGLEHIPRRSITLQDWGEVEDVTSTKIRYRAGDILFGKIRPYFHKVGFALTDGIASSDAIVLRPVDPTFYMFSLLTLSSDWFVAIVSKTAKEGSKMPRADWKLMENHLLAVPPRQLLELLNQFVDPVVEQLRALAFQNQKLRNARDLLLPRLMNGEISK